MRRALLLLAACGGAPEPRRAPTPAPPPAAPRLEIVARQLPSGLRVTYRLPRPAASFRFRMPSGPIRSETWHLLTPELVLADDEVKAIGGATFDTFELLITPDRGEYNRIYPALFAMGNGTFTLNTRYLAGDGFADARIELAAAANHQVVSSFHPPAARLEVPATADDKGHYVYFGDYQPAPGSVATFLFAPAVPEWLRTRLVEVANTTVPFLGEQLDQALASRPFVVVAYPDLTSDQATYRGDTAANGEIALRFRGRGWSAAGTGGGDESRFVMHELVHLWNGELARPPRGEHLAWLHEGSAEYLALVAGTRLGVLTGPQLHDHLARAINGCIDALGTGSLVNPDAPVRAGYYTCGVVVQWLADLSVKPGGDSFAIWKAVFAAAAKQDRTYSVEMFLAEVKRRGTDKLMAFMFSDQRDWRQLPRLVEPHGGKLEPLTGAPWDARRRVHLLKHVLVENCRGPHGFFSFDDHVRLDTGDRCGGLSGDPEVAFVEGHDLYKELDKAIGVLAQRCRQGVPVRLRDRAGRSVTARCARALPDPSPMFRVVAG